MVNSRTYNNLSTDRAFCQAMGRMTLAASRFESDLRAFLMLRGVHLAGQEATLGTLISKLKKHDLLSENGVHVLRGLKAQRNYLTHSLYDLFSARIDEGLMLRDELDDTTLLAEKAWVLEQTLIGLAEIAE
jgi:hypothetical protein